MVEHTEALATARRRTDWLFLASTCIALITGGLRTSAEPAAAQFRITDKSGRYTIEVTQVSQVRRFEPWNPQPRTMQVDLALYQSWNSLDPEAALGVTWPKTMAAVDDTGCSLQPLADFRIQDLVIPFRCMKTNFGWQPAAGSVRFVSPGPGATRIARLSGKAIVWVPGETLEVRIPLTPPARDRTTTEGRFQAALQSAGWEKDSYVVRLMLKGPGFWRLTSGYPESVPRLGDDVWPGFFQKPSFVLLGGEGKTVGHPLPSAASAGTAGGRAYRLSLDRRSVPGNLKPQTLVVRFLAGYGEVEVPFDFENIPLP